MAYIGTSPPATALTASDIADGIISVDKLATNAVTQVKVADDAIALAELKAGTDGELITWDASGNPVAVAVGSDGQVLTSTGAGSPPAFEALPAAAAGLNKIVKTTISGTSTATLTFNSSSVTSTYDRYIITGHIKPITDDQEIYMRLLDSSNNPISSSAYYEYNNAIVSPSNTNDHADQNAEEVRIPHSTGAVGNDTNEGAWILMHLEGFNESAMMSAGKWWYTGKDMYNSGIYSYGMFLQKAVAQSYGVQFYWEGGGNFAAGSHLTLYGVAK